MRVSTKGRYGIKAVMELARRYGMGPVSVRELSEYTEVPAAYLEQLINKLRNAHIVSAVRGSQGGYVLAEHPKDLVVGIVLRTLEGSLAPMICAEEGFVCANSQTCIESYLYRRIREGIDEVIDHITLQDMLDEQIKMINANDATQAFQEESTCRTK